LPILELAVFGLKATTASQFCICSASGDAPLLTYITKRATALLKNTFYKSEMLPRQILPLGPLSIANGDLFIFILKLNCCFVLEAADPDSNQLFLSVATFYL